jgi:hypothetical protein
VGVISCPEGCPSQPHTCVLCGQTRHLDDLTIGIYLHGQQALACNSHFFDGDKLYRGWATFVVTQYQEIYQPTVLTENEMRDVRPSIH